MLTRSHPLLPPTQSLRCLDCGKVFRTTDEASYHGTKSGHENFEESTEEKKPLTEEEKKAKLAELREKAAARKAAAAKVDAEEQKQNNIIRKKQDKDLAAIKEEMKLKEAQKLAEAKRREKIEDAKAKAKIKAQIEEDKKARAEKFAKEKALRDGTALPGESSATAPSGPKPPAANAVSAASTANKKETRLQIRLPTGNPVITTRQSEDTLQSVLEWIREQPNAAGIEGKISITYPRKVFTQAEMGKSLLELGLVPSSVLIVN